MTKVVDRIDKCVLDFFLACAHTRTHTNTHAHMSLSQKFLKKISSVVVKYEVQHLPLGCSGVEV